MNSKKDIFDLFREKQHLFDERPAPKTWRRLERRLDAHQRRSRISLYRSLGMVAGVLALVAMIALISLLVDQQRRDYLSDRPQQLENLEVPENETMAHQVVEFTRSYRDRTAKPIEEGEASRKLVPVERGDQVD